jgi:hypothetical protein
MDPMHLPRTCAVLRASAFFCLSVGLQVAIPVCQAQSAPVVSPIRPAKLTGTITDPSGAVVPRAAIHAEPEAATPLDAVSDAASDATGRFALALPMGSYTVTISAPGFEPLTRTVQIAANGVQWNAKLTVAARAEEVDVKPDSGVSTSAGENKSAVVFKGEELEALSNDDATFQQQLLAMAGGTGGSGEGSPQIYVDGFSGGQMPPKSAIREVRINSNPFSAEYEDLGYGRIEVFTKPGSDKFHGQFYLSGNDSAFNARNPIYTTPLPPPIAPYYRLYTRDSLSGPLGKKTSFFLLARYSDQQGSAIVNAYNPDGSALSQAVANPQTSSEFNLRLDRQITANNTLIARYDYDSSQATNSGVGLLVEAKEGVNTSGATQTLQLSDTQVAGSALLIDTHFQYRRVRNNQTPVSGLPTLVLPGYFNGGGSPAGLSHDNQDQYEFQEFLSLTKGKHFVRTGFRFRAQRETSYSTANYNGQFTFSTLAAFNAGTPSQFTLTAGQRSATLLTTDSAAFAEDEWKLRENLTLTYGLRLESQTAIPNKLNPAPRATLSWAVGQHGKHAAFVVLRANAGIFYDRFAASNLLTSVRQNGVSQQTFYVENPPFYANIPTPAKLSGGTPPTPYSVSPNLHVASETLGGFSVERALGRKGSMTATYLAVRGVHQYNSLNVNAPLPGTGVRPLGGTGDVYRFASDGIEKAQAFYTNANYQPAKDVFLWAFYGARRQTADTFGSTSFPSQPYNVSADMGPSGLGNQAIAQRLFAGFDTKLPFGFSADLFLGAMSRGKFNITTGTDRNGDSIFNDRPAFATAPGPSSILYTTRFGTFDANPQPGEAIIPYNYGLRARVVSMEMGLTRDFKFGPRPAPEPVPAGAPAPKGPAKKPDPRYDLVFTAEAENLLNHVNGGPPVGVLGSPEFGQPISLSSIFGSASGANRVVTLETSFRF